MGSLSNRLKRLEADLPTPGSVACDVCRDYPEYPVYYSNAGDDQLYSDDQRTQPAEHIWPCRACGHQPNAVRAIVVNYTQPEGPRYDAA